MLTVEIKINGSVVAVMSAVNRGNSPRGGFDLFEYEYQTARFPINNEGPCVTRHGKLLHSRHDGAEELARKLLLAAVSET